MSHLDPLRGSSTAQVHQVTPTSTILSAPRASPSSFVPTHYVAIVITQSEADRPLNVLLPFHISPFSSRTAAQDAQHSFQRQRCRLLAHVTSTFLR
eukprot:8298804-Pyramimonas_sp.AAC.1